MLHPAVYIILRWNILFANYDLLLSGKVNVSNTRNRGENNEHI